MTLNMTHLATHGLVLLVILHTSWSHVALTPHVL